MLLHQDYALLVISALKVHLQPHLQSIFALWGFTVQSAAVSHSSVSQDHTLTSLELPCVQSAQLVHTVYQSTNRIPLYVKDLAPGDSTALLELDQIGHLAIKARTVMLLHSVVLHNVYIALEEVIVQIMLLQRQLVIAGQDIIVYLVLIDPTPYRKVILKSQ